MSNYDQMERQSDKTEAERAHMLEAYPYLLAALKEIVRITDRKHNLWDKAKEAIRKAENR